MLGVPKSRQAVCDSGADAAEDAIHALALGADRQAAAAPACYVEQRARAPACELALGVFACGRCGEYAPPTSPAAAPINAGVRSSTPCGATDQSGAVQREPGLNSLALVALIVPACAPGVPNTTATDVFSVIAEKKPASLGALPAPG